MLIYHTEIINLLFLLFCAQSLKKQKIRILNYPIPWWDYWGTMKQSQTPCCGHQLNSQFSHDITKLQIKKLSISLGFYFHEVLHHLNTFIYTSFQHKRVLRFALEDAWIFRLLCDAVFSWWPGKLLCGLKLLLMF